MRATRVMDFGKPPLVGDVAAPAPDDDELLVRLHYAGVNPLDVRIAAGAAGDVSLPLTLGSEGAGVTPDGKRVLVYGHGLGLTRDGTYAEAVVVPDDAAVLIPDGVPSEQAAAVGVAAVTAWGAVHRVARVTAEDRVVVLGASGGVGSIAVQLARGCGATVLAQTSQEFKAAWLREQDVEVVVAGPDELSGALRAARPTVVLDGLGGAFTGAAAGALRTGGRHVVYGASAGRRGELDVLALYRKAVRLEGYASMLGDTRDDALRCLELIANGALRIPIDSILPLDEAATAHERLGERSVRGKVLLATQQA